MKVKELAEKLDAMNIKQTREDWREHIPDDIWDKYFQFPDVVWEAKIEGSSHTWFSEVVRCKDSFIQVTSLLGDNVEDFEHKLRFIEVKPETIYVAT